MTSNRATILLVDDESHVTDALSRHFPRERFEVLSARSAADAYEILDRRRVDVVISDERMPGEAGSEFLARVRQLHPATIRMILSGQASLDAAIRAINEGEVYRFFLKPCNPVDLLFTVQRALEHRRLAERSRALLAEYRKQAALLNVVERMQPGLLKFEQDESGAIIVEDDSTDSVEDLLREIEQSIAARHPEYDHA
ncbi:MAG TPA: response regulator [Steroidobacteraceae bacterium]|jgi:two-component system probable response regulator PhcQ|nr:response regulator [Steroidobacteraceae bacterium]